MLYLCSSILFKIKYFAIRLPKGLYGYHQMIVIKSYKITTHIGINNQELSLILFRRIIFSAIVIQYFNIFLSLAETDRLKI